MRTFYVELELEGADGVPSLTLAEEIETLIAGSSIACVDEDGVTAHVVIDSATVTEHA